MANVSFEWKLHVIMLPFRQKIPWLYTIICCYNIELVNHLDVERINTEQFEIFKFLPIKNN